ncbi:hypothetical protein EDB89DRAFT_2005437 [Lactarius sanguifluus]|nr:hypothetical protein EDB89DRAFT_2005437 [Lactarius sanguifluus]
MRRAASWRAASRGARDKACAARTYTLFEKILAVPARARITHLVLPHFVGVLPAAHVVPPNAASHLAVLDSSPSLAVALGSNHPLCRLTLRIASTLYDGLHPAAHARKELGLIFVPHVDIRTRGRIWARGWRYSGCRRRLVASRGMDMASAGIDIALHRVSFWGALGTRAGSGYA